ncbi:hypothetical protein HMPREF1143_2248 [Peptoanaerobacter stomatis]|jgi:hypothetical protein|uniref:Nucleotide exchange factor GrpE n=1 Tax=Peptoanaerobacter stomatis TaxID=796937 RepID=J5WQI3_9FIRM|nr:hypothetical protein [Peptoanaerobacter stomatis]EJU23637.1 hypothetical protein HMPREF1143_2248 [Peptoanaerobacter stomatis]NWO24284.1 hypothetical protein [Peptostreptococcaceae bacterium oral taxon 081]
MEKEQIVSEEILSENNDIESKKEMDTEENNSELNIFKQDAESDLERDIENMKVENEVLKETDEEAKISYESESKEETEVFDEDVNKVENSETYSFELKKELDELKDISEKTLIEIREVHKLYHNEYAGRLIKMQKELDEYHEIENGKVFDDILLDVAKLYCDNEQILEVIEDPKIKKQVSYIFEDIEQLLESYGVVRNKSELMTKRNIKTCKIRKTIETNDFNLNDTVAKSVKSGFSKGTRVLIKEDIYVNVYKENTTESE